MMNEALIGVAGTLSGTILGYVLNEYSKKGKNKISFEDVNIACTSYNIANCTISISMTLKIINTSAEIKNIIKPKIILKKDNKVFMEKFVTLSTEQSKYKDYYCCQPKIFTAIKLNENSEIIKIEDQSKELRKLTEVFENCELFFSYIDDHSKIKNKRIFKDCLNENEKFKNSLVSKQNRK